MWIHHLKIAIRNIIRHKGYAFLNIFGLAAGMACCILIGLWVLDELNYDRFHENASSICRVESSQEFNGRTLHIYWTPHPLGPALEAEIPEVKDSTRVQNLSAQLLRYEDKAFEEYDVWSVDPSFLDMFTFPMIQGNPENALSGTSSLVMTERLATKFFGDENPIGKVINVAQSSDFTVTGVLKDIPRNSTLQFDVLIPYEYLVSIGRTDDNFTNNQILTWIQLHSGVSAEEVSAKISGFVQTKVSRSLMVLELLPLTKVHLYTYSGYEKNLAVQSVYLFSVIAIFVLIIGCINFMNLSTARSAKRAKEVGLRKVVGAFRSQLIRQFYGESLLFAFIALGLAVAAVSVVLPAFGNLAGKDMSWNVTGAGVLILGLAGIALLTGLVSGSYPALFLASFQPVNTLKGKLRSGKGNAIFRRTLVVVQFVLSAALIIGTGVVSKQMTFIKNRNLGWNKEQVVAIPIRSYSRPSLETLKAELANTPGILNVAVATQKPSFTSWSSSGFDWEGKDPALKVDITYMEADDGYVDTLGMTIVQGRNFSKKFPTDKTESFLINEELARLMGHEDPIGKSFSFWDQKGKIIGVIEDFHFQPLRRKIEPLIIRWSQLNWTNFLFLRIAPEGIMETIGTVQGTWEKILPAIPFSYQFLDEDFATIYRSEERTGTLLKIFTAMAILVACLGLFGLASYAAEQRTKEIGIRKVLGASVPGITALMCREFLVLIGLANLIAWPVAYFAIKDWLDNFAYRTNIPALMFLNALILSLVIGLMTVIYRAIRAASANPVEALKHE
ncbi:MAG: ABC transporter permease [Candidatus Aminicenantes bacterium]|nr:MAG: ABC transporter permease [Candidatus Aminicenantes bacterium]